MIDHHHTKRDLRVGGIPHQVCALQDPLGKQGHRVWNDNNGHSVWMRQLADGSVAIVLFNTNVYGTPSVITANFTDLGFTSSTRMLVRELFDGQDLGICIGSFTSPVNINDVVMVRAWPLPN
jgi:hypothetical protein